MTKQYHHGNLKEELIFNGLILLNEKGVEGFSMRKVASMCSVSHNAPYKHFKNKEDFIQAISKEVWAKFHDTLKNVSLDEDMGRVYVKFMVKNPEYLKFMFLSEHPVPVKVKGNTLTTEQDGSFKIFLSYAEKIFEKVGLPKEDYMKQTLVMWSVVHGLSVLIVKGNIEYEGDIDELIDSLFN